MTKKTKAALATPATEMTAITRIKMNPDNPRIIKDAKFEKLVNSLRNFPKMLWLRPIVLDKNNMVIGSGTTMVASQQLGRLCYGMDLEPRNCQITINRMRKLAPQIEVSINGQTVD